MVSHKSRVFKYLQRSSEEMEDAQAGQVRMDLEPGRTRVHEHAETGRPRTANKEHGTPGRTSRNLACFSCVVRPCRRYGQNGQIAGNGYIAGILLPPRRPAIAVGIRGSSGNGLCAIGLPQYSASSSGFLPRLAHLAAPTGGRLRHRGHTSDSQVIPSACPHTFRSRSNLSVPPGLRFPDCPDPTPTRLASSSGRCATRLAKECIPEYRSRTSRQRPLDGKVRWQKRFVFPQRRTKRGLQSSKTISSQKFTTSARTNTRWPDPFTTAASPAFSPECSPHSSILDWSATPSFM